jgi:hypothetical protein
MKITDPSLPGWAFTVNELSAGVFEVVGRGPNGETVSRKGTDPDTVVSHCKDDARALA